MWSLVAFGRKIGARNVISCSALTSNAGTWGGPSAKATAQFAPSSGQTGCQQSVDPLWCLPKRPTPLVNVFKNLHAKLEGVHASGSIKDRAVGQCVYGLLSSGTLLPGGTLVCCTSGSAGLAMLHVQQLLANKGISIDVKIFMPKAYLSNYAPMAIAKAPGVQVVDAESQEEDFTKQTMSTRHLCALDGLFVDVLAQMKELAGERGWSILDQHFDVNGMLAHQGTAVELLQQLPSITDVVCTTGTGATAAGLRKFLPPNVAVHARPAESGSIAGLCDVRRYANFCNTDLLEGYASNFFDPKVASGHQELLSQACGIDTGPSGGASFALAREIAQANPEAQVAFVCADGRPTAPANSKSPTLSSGSTPMSGIPSLLQGVF